MEAVAALLPPGRHAYEDILAGVRSGRYRFARIRAASGRLNVLIGLSPAQLDTLAREAARRGLGLALIGSRVSGPRLRQRTLDPLLAELLPLSAEKRTPSPTWPGAEGLRIEKTAIKEFGLNDPHTSDLHAILIDPTCRPEAVLARQALELELAFRGLGTSFPIKVMATLEGRRFRGEEDFIAHGAGYLARLLPPGTTRRAPELRRAFSELYAPVGVARPLLVRADLVNGLWNAVLASLSFSAALPLHPVVPVAAFAFGLGGRYLARLKTWVSGAPAETPASNAAALALDGLIGTALMALLVNPVAGWGLPLDRILQASALHTLSKGSWRLWLDKRCSRLDVRGQARGVFLASGLNFLIGLVTAFVYAGRPAAVVLQAALAGAGLALAFRRGD
ncbi:MAG: hypothetical protein HYZ75_12895 [Elusimicrobia bacterium]|nr:hypothetical protein [Elusimicrobiota bacterium]